MKFETATIKLSMLTIIEKSFFPQMSIFRS